MNNSKNAPRPTNVFLRGSRRANRLSQQHVRDQKQKELKIKVTLPTAPWEGAKRERGE